MLALAAAGTLVYASGLSAPPVLDDQLTIFENPQIRDWRSLSVLFPERELPVAGRPLVNVSLAANYAFGQTAMTGYRVVNLALHVLCAVTLFGLVRRGLAKWVGPAGGGPTRQVGRVRQLRPPVGPAGGVGSLGRVGRNWLDGTWASSPEFLAGAVALIWLLHPLNSEVVLYVSQRTESMMALCYLLTLYASVRSLDAARWQVAAVAACAAGMACKESMVTAPVMVMLLDRVFVFGSWRDAARSRWRFYAALMMTWLLLAALLWSGPRMHSAGFETGLSPWTYLLNQSVMILHYLRLAIWPRGLVVYYGFPLPLGLGDVLPQMLIVTALVALTAAAFAVRPRLALAGAWFFLTLAPTSSVIPIATEVGAERRMYLPLVALVVLAVLGASRVPAPRLRVPVLALVAVLLGTGTALRARAYESGLTLAETALAGWPNAVAHHYLGEQLILAGRPAEGISHLRQALAGAPRAHYTLGQELFREGRLDEAAAEMREFVRLEPTLLEVPSAHVFMAKVHLRKERWGQAATELRTALAMAPRHAEARGLLALALFKQEALPEAVDAYRAYLQLAPNDQSALANLGIALVASDKIDEALAVFRRAAQIDPRGGEARRNLATALLDADRPAEAATEAREAIVLRPDDPAVYDLLGQALARQGQFPAAREAFLRALQADAGHADARRHLSQIEHFVDR